MASRWFLCFSDVVSFCCRIHPPLFFFLFFFFNDTATTEIYTLSLHDALPIYRGHRHELHPSRIRRTAAAADARARSEEHTSELQSHLNLVCRLLLEKKKSCSGSSRCSSVRRRWLRSRRRNRACCRPWFRSSCR